MQPIREFDHLMCGVRDLSQVGRSYERLGFTIGPITPLEGVGVANRRILLTPNEPDCANYIEFMQLGGAGGEIPTYLEKWLKGSREGREGAGSMIMRTDDAHMAFDHFMQRHDKDPKHGFRPILLELEFDQFGPEDETYRVAFSNCIMPDLDPPLFLSTSQITTLDFYLNDVWRKHPNGAQSCTATVAMSDDPLATAHALYDIWGGTVEEYGPGCIAAAPGRIPLFILEQSAFIEKYGEPARDGTRPLPFISGVHLTTSNFENTRIYFEKNGIEHSIIGQRLILPPSECHGLMICFEPALTD
ncbi:VOC family protein [Parasphingorhabdus sp.]|uniref:VOC family protein n=1 Tax=Parasphingorhabdus sp. TaxID=2709688 RepID=UPI00326525AA